MSRVVLFSFLLVAVAVAASSAACTEERLRSDPEVARCRDGVMQSPINRRLEMGHVPMGEFQVHY